MSEIVKAKSNAERINYTLRPAKHAERKMFCETFTRLSALDNIKNYRYIGMGSAYFSDFSLFHKTLGITKLLSIESEDSVNQKKRIRFNIPYSCIDVRFGFSCDVLSKLPWSKWKNKSIVWLDYVDKLKEWMLGDIETVIFNILPGSVFLLSLNIEKEEQSKEILFSEKMTDQQYRIKKLEENIGKSNIPLRAYEMNLSVDKNKLIIREIIHNSILNSIKKRNGGLRVEEQLEYKQLFNIYYKDSADMLTVGGIIYNTGQKQTVERMFKNLDFIRHAEETFDIIVPKLTFREIHALDKALPNKNTLKTGVAKNGDKKIPLSETDVKNYANIYRYFPTFTESNL
jgi:hypothetical protein